MEQHRNNIGFLRLLLALSVIVGHAPEMIDGNRVREPLTLLFHTFSLGEMAVDGFFVLSGFLITQSMVRSSSPWSYLKRRILRIYPAFIVAFTICVLIIAPFTGGQIGEFPRTLFRMAMLLTPPSYPGQLAGLAMPTLNGSMWTISYEFHCYILIAVLGVCGLIRSGPVVLAITVIFLLASFAETFTPVRLVSDHIDLWNPARVLTGAIFQDMRLFAAFLVGASFYTFQARIWPWLTGKAVIAVVMTMIPLLFFPHVAELALVLFGGLGLIWLGFRANFGHLQRINDKWDVSYGVYLYGWPIAITILWLTRTKDPMFLAAATVPVALACGAASWWGLERWLKDFGSRSSAGSTAAPPSQGA